MAVIHAPAEVKAVIIAAKVVATVFPRCGAVADARFGPAKNREVPDDLLRALSALRASDELEDV